MGRKRRRPWGRSHKAGCPRKGLFSQLNVFELMFFSCFQSRSKLPGPCVCLHNASYLEADQTLGSAFPAWLFLLPFSRGAGSWDKFEGAGGAGAPGCCPGDPGKGRNRGRGSRQTCRPVFLCPTFLLFPLPPSECTGSPAGGGLLGSGVPKSRRGTGK